MRLAITEILADPEGYLAERKEIVKRDDGLIIVSMKTDRPVDASEITPIASGDYALRVMMWVRTVISGEAARNVVSDEIGIHLGPPADEAKGP